MHQQITYNGLVGFELEKIRKELGMEQSEVSVATGISQPVLSRLEKGKAMITIDQLFVICGALGVKPEDIISKTSKGVEAFSTEEAVKVTTTKEASTSGAILTGAAIGALLTLFLTKGK
ncbi:helix-turn-helix domain-containing protein [Shewanella pealeana]|uniref:Transcriptional regulator, XRE family n=1 Tax=Shewanella pealeana (strain ATCC 700345 / ANG-SQ1) TaxID=398579 RepID=A8H219_SHEPA|nr:helix-turn-helix transcriptional regulator [Shewanella pealeana]ABV86606.1 transcriptional regulator, XRE family [Shewanella pealeana ATCC 700345]